MGAVYVNLDLGANEPYEPFRQQICGCGVSAPYMGANLRLRNDWLTVHDPALTQNAVAASTCDNAAIWLDFPSRLGNRRRIPGHMTMLGESEVQMLAVFYQNQDRLLQETEAERASWASGYDWTSQPRNAAHATSTPWLTQVGSRDYVQRCIAETVRDAAVKIANGTYANPGVRIAIMNTETTLDRGLHWVLIMYEIPGPQ